MEWTDWLTATSAMIAAVAVACTAYFAKQGMSVWRQQMRGKDEYKLARDLLASIYKFRDAMHDARHPFMTIVEKPPRDEAEHMSSGQIRFYGLSRAYSNRWNKVSKQHRKLYKNWIVAQAVWGDKLVQLVQPLHEQEQELRVAIEEYLELIKPEDQTNVRENAKRLRELRPMLYGLPEDEFGQQIENSIKPLEQYLKQKFGDS